MSPKREVVVPWVNCSRSTWLSPVPTDISRFLALINSTERSLSPERELRQMTAQVADVLHYGSPRYNAQLRALLCPHDGPLRQRSLAEYRQLPNCDGVTCEFCGDTTWLTGDQACEASAGELLWHCDACPYDLCSICATDDLPADRMLHTTVTPRPHAPLVPPAVLPPAAADEVVDVDGDAKAEEAESDQPATIAAAVPAEDPLAALCKWRVAVEAVSDAETSAALVASCGSGAAALSSYSAASRVLTLRFRSRVLAESAKALLGKIVAPKLVTLTPL